MFKIVIEIYTHIYNNYKFVQMYMRERDPDRQASMV